MCHQTVCLIARQLEAAGIATVTLTSARDITASANPPRAVFVDYPLGHTAGRVNDLATSREIVGAALDAFASTTSGTITDLPHRWSETDDWKDDVMAVETASDGAASSNDSRVERYDTPQYQTAEDAKLAAARHVGSTCLVCAGLDY